MQFSPYCFVAYGAAYQRFLSILGGISSVLKTSEDHSASNHYIVTERYLEHFDTS